MPLATNQGLMGCIFQDMRVQWEVFEGPILSGRAAPTGTGAVGICFCLEKGARVLLLEML